ncbi:MAG: NUDIX hydrolase [Ignavibacteriaceae bacterium]
MNQKDIVKLKSRLPKKPGIMGKENYFNSAVLIPLILIKGEYHLLFEKRAAGIRQGSEVCFPGGEFDPGIDKNFRDTAVRETFEEIGVKKTKIKIIGQLDTLIGPMGVTVEPFIGVLDLPGISKIVFDKNEVEKIFTVPYSFFERKIPEKYSVRLQVNPIEVDDKGNEIKTFPAAELHLPPKYNKLWHGKQHSIFVYKTSGEVIWGITAELIHELVSLFTKSFS